MTLTVYHYPRCSTSRKAIQWLEDHGRTLNKIDITLYPPDIEQLRQWVCENKIELKWLYNTSGQVYRQLNLKEKRKQLTEEEQLQLLASNGKLIKRPLVTDGNQVTVGFKEEVFEQLWS